LEWSWFYSLESQLVFHDSISIQYLTSRTLEGNLCHAFRAAIVVSFAKSYSSPIRCPSLMVALVGLYVDWYYRYAICLVTFDGDLLQHSKGVNEIMHVRIENVTFAIIFQNERYKWEGDIKREAHINERFRRPNKVLGYRTEIGLSTWRIYIHPCTREYMHLNDVAMHTNTQNWSSTRRSSVSKTSRTRSRWLWNVGHRVEAVELISASQKKKKKKPRSFSIWLVEYDTGIEVVGSDATDEIIEHRRGGRSRDRSITRRCGIGSRHRTRRIRCCWRDHWAS
jgi:hypothetical protein